MFDDSVTLDIENSPLEMVAVTVKGTLTNVEGKQCAVMIGDFNHGFEMVGPFDTWDAAQEYRTRYLVDDGYEGSATIVPLSEPKDEYK